MDKFALLVLTGLLSSSFGLPNYQEWVARSDRDSYQEDYRYRRQAFSNDPGVSVRVFNVNSRIAVRFAEVTITCRVYNGDSSPQPYTYDLILPPDAYISNFTLIVDGEVYQGMSRDQCEGEDPFNFAASGSVTFGSIRPSELTRNLFLVGVNLAPRSQATFIVEYQEMLSRSAGWYTQVISVRPGQSVQDFQITANVNEPQGIQRIETAIDTESSRSTSEAAKYAGYAALPATFSRGSSQYVVLNNELQQISRTSARFNFQPSISRQLQFPGNKGIFGDFILRYDVVHAFDIGYIQMVDDVFVHYFSPTGPQPIKKNVVFVIDVSGSMYGLKLMQTKEALTTILGEVRSEDLFNVVAFSDDVRYWTRGDMVQATSANIESAKQFVIGLQPRKGTNLNSAVLSGLRLLEATGSMESAETEPSICIVFLLTDGKPTGDVSSVREIESNARQSNRGRCSLVTLGFGSDVDFNFLARLALQNRGVARKIFTGASAAKQLKGVYDEVATPLLSDITVEYTGNVVDPESLSSTNFSNYFNGSEISVTGRLVDPSTSVLPVRIIATGSEGEIQLEEDVNIRRKPSRSLRGENVPDEFAERTWAFLTLSELFKRFTLADDADERRVLVDRSIELSERYNLLTPLMSLGLVDENGVPITSSQGGLTGDDGQVLSQGSPPPTGYQWGIVGPAYGVRGDTSSTFGIGTADCSVRTPATEAPPTPEESFVDLHSMHITSKITERYARTDVTAVMTNRGTAADDIEFAYQIPNGGFVSDFSVTIGGVQYRGFVQDRRDGEWRNVFAQSEAGNTVILQTRRDPSKSMFVMRMPNVSPQVPVTFQLTYDQLLKRVGGKYRHIISLWPGEIIEDFSINAHITEPQGIDEISSQYQQRGFVSPIDLRTRIRRNSNTRAHIHYSPTEQQQLEAGDDGIEGDIIFEYDVEHNRDGSHTQVQNGYFVHYFSPTGTQEAAKHIVFVIDVSASMYGTKLRQVKDALKVILDDLNPADRFNVITFSDSVRYWRTNRLVPGTSRNIREAKAYVESLVDEDETNLNAAILAADELLDNEASYLQEGENVMSLMIVLTDGKPSQGVVDSEEILTNARNALNGEHALFSIGFGRDVEYDLLVQLALQNNGFSRKVYETLAVNQELRDLYSQVSRPLLFDVAFNYNEGHLNSDSMSQQVFPVYFDGSELLVVGKLDPDDYSRRMPGTVEAKSSTGDFYKVTSTDLTGSHPDLSRPNAVENVIERIWALQTIQGLIDEYSVTDDPHRRRVIADEVVRMGREYNLVTPLTSLSLYDPSSGNLIKGANTDPVPLPAYNQAEGSIERLTSAIDLSPAGQTTVVRPVQLSDAPLATDSSPGVFIDKLHAISLIALRFTTTTIEQDITNTGSRKGQAVFKQKIPLDAFITNITITIDDTDYTGGTKDLDGTRNLNLGTLETGRSGGIITPLDHESKLLILSVPLASEQTATFTVTYQKLLPRRRGVYQQKIFLFPEQIVDDMLVDTVIVEPQGLYYGKAYLDDRNLDMPRDFSYLFDKTRDTRWSIQYRPSQRQQGAISSRGIAGEFVVEYDVEHSPDAGDIQILDDYFVHFFSPSGLSVLRKNVVFVIDISDSMAGTKLQQVKDALKTILGDMRPTDKFNILPFHSGVDFLDRFKMLEASTRNIRAAKEFVNNLQPEEATNLNRAILEGINQLRREAENSRDTEKVVSMLIVLTDGEPTYGETEEALIERNVREAINGDYSLFALGFGEDVDFPFLTRLALQNYGVARKIPARADASQLLEGFYEEVATPLLHDLEVRYSRGIIEPQSLSDISFANYFNGSELVVVGKLLSNVPTNVLQTYVFGQTATESVQLTSSGDARIPSLELLSPDVPQDLLAKLWSYQIIKSFITDKEEREDNAVYTAELDRDIVDLSLEHKFFNHYTAFIINDPATPASSEPIPQPIGMRIVEGALPALTQEDLVQRLSVRLPQLVEDINAPIGSTGQPGGGQRGGGGAVDNDPHFLVHVPKSNINVCFDIGYQPGTAINLLQDAKRGLYVNGGIIGANLLKDGKKQFRTYIGSIAVLWFYSQRKPPMEVLFTPDNVTLSYSHALQWGQKVAFKHKGLKVAVSGKQADVTFRHNATFTILRHKMPDKNKEHKPNYLGFYLETTEGLSDGLHGLIGQFQNTRIEVLPLEGETGKTAELHLKRRSIHVKMGSRTNNLKNIKRECWKADDNGADLIDGHYTDYIMSNIFGTM